MYHVHAFIAETRGFTMVGGGLRGRCGVQSLSREAVLPRVYDSVRDGEYLGDFRGPE